MDSGSDLFPALIRGREGDKGYLHRKLEWNEEVSLKHKFKKAITERGRTRSGESHGRQRNGHQGTESVLEQVEGTRLVKEE